MFRLTNRPPIPNGLHILIRDHIQCAFAHRGASAPTAGFNWYQYNDRTVFIREAIDRRNNSMLSVAFKFKNRMPPMDKLYVFYQSPDDSVDVLVERIRQRIANEIRLRIKLGMTWDADENDTKRFADGEIPDFNMSLIKDSGDPIDGIVLNEVFAANAESESVAGTKFKIQQEEFSVMYNGPHVSYMELPPSIMVGEDCYPTNMRLDKCRQEDCTYVWYKGLPNDDNTDQEIEWKRCGDTFMYNVTQEDVGYKLKVECTPRRDKFTGPSLSVRSRTTVVAKIGGEFDAFAERHKMTSSRWPHTGDRFRVVSYNILADFYNESKSSLSEWYPYCRPEALEIAYRKKLFIRELRGYNSDIICLQETDTKIFREDLKPMMETNGMAGSLKRKGAMPEGMVTFYDTNKFSLIWTGGFTVGDYLNGHPSMVKLLEKIKPNEAFCNRILLLPTSLQLTLLKSNFHNRFLLVANTHLYAALDAAHIRAVQAQAMLEYIKYYRDNRLKELNIPDERVSMIFCGDFNSKPEQAIFKLMTEKSVPSGHPDFESNQYQTPKDLSLEQSFNLGSAYDTNIYTNYTAGFKGCLDYIFYEKNTLNPIQTVPIPSEEILSMETALPSTYFPSDHISLVADFEWLLK